MFSSVDVENPGVFLDSIYILYFRLAFLSCNFVIYKDFQSYLTVRKKKEKAEGWIGKINDTKIKLVRLNFLKT